MRLTHTTGGEDRAIEMAIVSEDEWANPLAEIIERLDSIIDDRDKAIEELEDEIADLRAELQEALQRCED